MRRGSPTSRVTGPAMAAAAAGMAALVLGAAGCAGAGHPAHHLAKPLAAVSHPAATFTPYSESFTPPASSGPSTPLALPSACKHQLTAWLSSGGKNMLHAIHADLDAYNRDDGAVVHDLLNGGNTAGDIATWRAGLYLLQRDALALQSSPAPSCAGGTELTRAADAWAEAATAYLAAARILGSSPNLGGISQSDGHMTTGNNSMSRAKRALKMPSATPGVSS